MTTNDPQDQPSPEEEPNNRRVPTLVLLVVAVILLIFCSLAGYYVVLPLFQRAPAAPVPTSTPTASGGGETGELPEPTHTQPPPTSSPIPTETEEVEDVTATPTATPTPLPALPSPIPSPTPVLGAVTFTGQVTVLGGDVYVLHSGSTAFVKITGTQSLSVGDIVRTGANGLALLSFGSNTETTLFGNTQVQVNRLQRDEATGQTFVGLSQYIGKMQNRVNLGNGSTFLVQTPPATGGTGTGSFTTEVFYDAHLGFSASQVEQVIRTNCTFAGGFISLNCVEGLGQITSNYFAENGSIPVSFVHVIDGHMLVTPQPGQQLAMRAEVIYDIVGSRAILVTEWVLVIPGVGGDEDGGDDNNGGGHCGDGVCDPYAGEDNLTCPADCP